jgi:hypothetical protein
MKILFLLVSSRSLIPTVSAETEGGEPPSREPKLYDYQLDLKSMLESVATHSLEEQATLQLRIRAAERRACQQMSNERRDGVPRVEYRRDGGDEFLVFSLKLEKYCQTLH